MKHKLRAAFFGLLVLELFFANSVLVSAQSQNDSYINSGAEASIKQFLCSPSPATSRGKDSFTLQGSGSFNPNKDNTAAYQEGTAQNTASGDLYICINRIYRFAIVVAGAFGVFMIVLAGYIYMSADGNEESVSKAKDMLTTTIVSLIILMAGYVLLRALNPDLIQFQKIQPNSVVLQTAGAPVIGTGGSAVGTGSGSNGIGSSRVGNKSGTGRCVEITNPSNPASVANLQNTCLKPNATLFSQIANEETLGQSIPSTVDKCSDGNVVSFGLFQINISATDAVKVGGVSCKTAFDKPFTASDKSCKVINQNLYQQCRTAALDPTQNIQAACVMSNNGTNLSSWNGSCFNRWVSN